MISSCGVRAASKSGETPFRSTTFGFPPFERRNLTMPTWPALTAQCRGVLPLSPSDIMLMSEGSLWMTLRTSPRLPARQKPASNSTASLLCLFTSKRSVSSASVTMLVARRYNATSSLSSSNSPSSVCSGTVVSTAAMLAMLFFRDFDPKDPFGRGIMCKGKGTPSNAATAFANRASTRDSSLLGVGLLRLLRSIDLPRRILSMLGLGRRMLVPSPPALASPADPNPLPLLDFTSLTFFLITLAIPATAAMEDVRLMPVDNRPSMFEPSLKDSSISLSSSIRFSCSSIATSLASVTSFVTAIEKSSAFFFSARTSRG
mmetsp:Transcript_70241/g.222703  ORF Transcript_70241/g.222703 Transcript_70241/m.222703 type:complete len:317 (+) Transcript_70241:979-1929(+)